MGKAGKDAEAVPWAVRNLRQFEIAVESKTCGLAVAMNAVEAALMLIEIQEPDRAGGAASWKDCAARALRWISETRMRLDSNETTRRAELAKRVAALP